MISHHPDDLMLQAYAAGHLAESMALLIATHLALCPTCRKQVSIAESLAGVLLEELPPLAMTDGSLNSALSLLDVSEGTQPTVASRPPALEQDAVLPEPLRGVLGKPLSELPWRQRGAIADIDLSSNRAGFTSKLLRIRKGAAVPLHRHEGIEATIVLAGSFRDAREEFRRGDVSVVGRDTVHQPVADNGEDCICLAVTDAPIYLAGPIGRLLNLFIKY